MAKDFKQIVWDESVEEDCRQIIRLAVREDLDRLFDWTTGALVPSGAQAQAALVARQKGVLAGMPAARLAIAQMDAKMQLSTMVEDGAAIAPGQTIGILSGPARSLLTAERTILNLVCRLSGVATLTRCYVDAVAGHEARIYDTRKTTPGWRRLEKYAVRCGGGHNHRTGLYDAILIKDNHLAFEAAQAEGQRLHPAEAVRKVRDFVASMTAPQLHATWIVEVEVDTLDQLAEVLPAEPDLALLDNMPLDVLRQAVAMRDAAAPAVELEASGGVDLDTVAAIASTGVDRISVGALTHSAPSLDIGLDWR